MNRYDGLESELKDIRGFLVPLQDTYEAVRLAYARKDPALFSELLKKFQIIAYRIDNGLQWAREELVEVFSQDGDVHALGAHEAVVLKIEEHTLRILGEFQKFNEHIARKDKKFVRKVRV